MLSVEEPVINVKKSKEESSRSEEVRGNVVETILSRRLQKISAGRPYQTGGGERSATIRKVRSATSRKKPAGGKGGSSPSRLPNRRPPRQKTSKKVRAASRQGREGQIPRITHLGDLEARYRSNGKGRWRPNSQGLARGVHRFTDEFRTNWKRSRQGREVGGVDINSGLKERPPFPKRGMKNCPSSQGHVTTRVIEKERAGRKALERAIGAEKFLWKGSRGIGTADQLNMDGKNREVRKSSQKRKLARAAFLNASTSGGIQKETLSPENKK